MKKNKILGLAFIVFVVLFFAILLNLKSEEMIKISSLAPSQFLANGTVSTRIQKASDVKCSIDECLTPIAGGEIYGTAKISGFYITSPKEAFGKKSTCSEFVITGGSSIIRDYFIKLVNIGNTVNHKDDSGRPVINIDLSSLNVTEKNKIVNSTALHNIDMVVLKRTEAGTEASVCFSFVDILSIK